MSSHACLKSGLRDDTQPEELNVPTIQVPQHECDAIAAERNARAACVGELEGELRRRGSLSGEGLIGSVPAIMDEQVLWIRQRHGVDSLLSWSVQPHRLRAPVSTGFGSHGSHRRVGLASTPGLYRALPARLHAGADQFLGCGPAARIMRHSSW
jgi:hypothetical protein